MRGHTSRSGSNCHVVVNETSEYNQGGTVIRDIQCGVSEILAVTNNRSESNLVKSFQKFIF